MLKIRIYTSPYTQHFPNGEFEVINRTITISDKEIIIESETVVDSIHKQTFIINGISEEEFQEYGLSRVFVTSSKDNIRMTYFLIPISDKVEIIEILQPSQHTYPASQWRLLVD